jgi:hypothetical protein
LASCCGVAAEKPAWVARTERRSIQVDRARTVHDFQSDRQALLRAGSILGGTVGLVALATGALRNALVASGHEQTAPSATAVLAYAAGATAMLAIAYVPAYLSIQRAGRAVVHRYVPEELPGSPAYDVFKKTRGDWEDHLHLKVGPVGNLKIGTAVLTPIVTGLASAHRSKVLGLEERVRCEQAQRTDRRSGRTRR